MRQVLWLLCALICVTFTSQLMAQDSEGSTPIPFGVHRRSIRYTIRGSLLDVATNRGVSGVKVDLRKEGGATVSNTFTTDSGEFSFTDVGSGTYEISVTEVGYQAIDQQISVEDSVFGLQLWLRKANNQPDGSPGAKISVRELSIPRKAHEDMLKGLNLLYQKSDYRGSIEQFQRAIKEFPSFYEAYGQMAVAYMDLGDIASEEDALKKSIDVSQQHYSDAYFALATLYVDKKRFADAEPIARKGVELDDTSWSGHFELASALFGLDRYPEAEAEAKTAAQRQPDDADTHLLLANIHIRLRNYSAVLDDVDTYLKLNPNGAQAEQARHVRDQVQAVLQKAQSDAAENDSPDAEDTPAPDQAPDSH